MKKYTLSRLVWINIIAGALLNFQFTPVNGQTLLTKIPIPKSYGGVIRTFDFGDSLLLKTGLKKFWVKKDGQVFSGDLITSEKPGLSLNEIILYGSDYFTYFLGNKNEAPFLTIGKNNNFDDRKLLNLKGKVLVTFKYTNLFILTFDKEDKVLRVFEVEKDEVKHGNSFNLPFDLSRFSPNEIQYIDPGQHVLLSDAPAKLKIYFEKGKLYLTVDEPYLRSFDETKTLAKTLIFSFDLRLGDFKMRAILEPSHSDFRSFVHDGLLYRITNDREKFELNVYDSIGSLVGSSTLLRNFETKKQPVYLRQGAENQISDKENLNHMMLVAKKCKPFLIVENNINNKPILTWGTYYNAKGIQGPLTGPSIPIVFSLAVAVAGTAIKQSMEGPGISRYFYLIKDEIGRYKLAPDGTVIPREAIDSYEIFQQEKGLIFNLKTYSNFDSKTLGIYKYQKKDTLEIIDFGPLYR